MNNHYVTTDLHGHYNEYAELLAKIRFDTTDRLYILGDLCDRGPAAAEIYLDVMKRPNVFCIKGNHEKMMLEGLEAMISRGIGDPMLLDCCDWFSIVLWSENGGNATVHSIMNLEKEERTRMLNFIRELPLYRTLKLGDTEYVMVHGGLDGYDPDKPLSAYSIDELVWSRPRGYEHYWPRQKRILLVGHTPTFFLREELPASIYYGENNVIFLDCGAAYRESGGRVGCLCLETGEEYYV